MICTRNRAASLRETLTAFFNLAPTSDYEYELVVVDNGSTDATRVIIAECMAKLPTRHRGRLRYCYESHSGLSNARNAALRTAIGDVLVFIDDDIWPSANWLDEIADEFATDPNLSLLGGRVLLAQAHLQPVGIVVREQRQVFTTPDGAGMIIGANIAFRRELLMKVGGFDPRLGAGGTFAAGEDVDFVYRAMKAGYKLLYAPNVMVYHNHDRVSREQACTLEYKYGNGAIAYFLKHIFKGDIYAIKVAYWSLRKKCECGFRWTKASEDATAQSRAYLRGVADALFPALIRMW
jgi:GT2 family glycosyltransferase